MATTSRMSTRCVAFATDALDGTLLNRAQQLGLGRRRQVGDLVEKQRAARGVLELAPPPPDAGGRPVLDAEQLGFQQRFDDGRAIDGDERSAPPGAQLVNLAGDQFFAAAALALDQHRDVGAGDPLDPFAQFAHGGLRPIRGAAPSRTALCLHSVGGARAGC